MSYTPDYIITNISSSNLQFDKSVDQIPVVLSIPGPLSLRDKATPYTVTVGNKKIK
jgi:hypothetical protein